MISTLQVAVFCGVALVVLVHMSRSTEYKCGPFCPFEGDTLTSCVTLCDELKPDLDLIFDPPQGLFRNGTPCWLSGERGGPVGQCCGDECKANGSCKSTMHKCKLQEEIRRNVTAGKLEFVKRMFRRNISVNIPSPQ
uniref:Putative secreted protein n=1 Tax=Amblyomma triste TaxID=251400 RepID=A0A023G0Z5_AMBTT